MKPVVFIGPSLCVDGARRLLEADFRPPAAKGDIYRATLAGTQMIGLVDGLFLSVASVWHREILHALRSGVHVFGAASMGALRAAELDGFGMRGVGAIYEAYRAGVWPGFEEPFEDDDEVAVVHAPAEAGSVALSDPMVDIRATLSKARDEGVLIGSRAAELLAQMKALHYPERSFTRLRALDPALARWLPAGIVNQKRVDAEQMLSQMSACLVEAPGPFRAKFKFENAQVWDLFMSGEAAHDDSRETRWVLNLLRLDPAAWRRAVRAAVGRGARAPVADRRERARQLDRLRTRTGLWQRADLDVWLEANGLDAAGLARLLDGEAELDAAIARANSGSPEHSLSRRLIDHLRVAGAYEGLLAKIPPHSWDETAPVSAAALDWYFHRLGVATVPPLDDWTETCGWPSLEDFKSSVVYAYHDALVAGDAS